MQYMMSLALGPFLSVLGTFLLGHEVEVALRMHSFYCDYYYFYLFIGEREVAYFSKAAPSHLTFDCCGRASVQ